METELYRQLKTSLSSGTPKQDTEPPGGADVCDHYSRGCSLVAPCCGKVFSCRLCHDDAVELDRDIPIKDKHKLDRSSIVEIVCNSCDTRQPVSNLCVECNKEFGKYYCSHCRLFDDDTSKNQYHCEKCGFCRSRSLEEEYFHCDKCNICLPTSIKETHRCIDIKNTDCPVCLESLFLSTKPYVLTEKCDHPIHRHCLEQMLNNGNYKCPLCSISLVDMTKYNILIDNEIANNPMPEEYKDVEQKVLCNDCNKTSTVPFHFIGHKCSHCGSYNTKK